MLRLVLAFLCAAVACFLVAGALSSAQSPATSTPDPFAAQITHAPGGRDSSAGDTSANGRFVVIESDGDIATEKTATRNNQDGNREIFLFDYAQRRIFQITDTKSVLKPAGSPSPSPSPSPSVSPTASPSPTPVDVSNVAIEISNNRPMLSLEPPLSSGQRTYTVVFSSNAPVTPASFDGTDPGTPTNTDMNQEIWTYQFTVPDTVDLASGAEVGPIDLTTGTFTRITNTPASRAPSAGSTTVPPFIADDNRDGTISDNGNIIAFISTRDLVPPGNVDTGVTPNPEVFLFNRTSAAFTQVTNTKSPSDLNTVFSSNPCLSSDGSALAFVSNANLTATNADGNAEVYLKDGAGLRQITRTKDPLDSQGHVLATGTIFSFGRRLSRDGKFLAFESLANDPKADGTNASFYVSFVYDVAADTFAQLGPRATAFPGDVAHFPTFTDYDSGLSPKSVLFTSALNMKSDGTILNNLDTAGLNPRNSLQVFLAPLPLAVLPAVPAGPFTRLTNTPASPSVGLRALPSNSRRRIAFSVAADLGGGNSDGSKEVFYHLSPDITTESTGGISLFTGASLIPVASPAASPNPSSSPFVVPGLAAGELAVAQFTLSPAPSAASVSNNSASETKRAPSLPVELNGVSISINGAACGIYSVSSSAISFVVPISLVPNTGTDSYPVVINFHNETAGTGTVIRGQVVIVAAQPDIFTASGRAVVCNITNPSTPGCLIEPFNVTSDNGTGTQVPTVLEVHLTGVRGTAASAINVVIGTTVIIPTTVISLDQPGFDEVDFTLPSTVDRGDLPIVVKVGTATSRPTDSAPHVTINP